MDELIVSAFVWSFLWASWLAAINHNEKENGPAWKAILFLTLVSLEAKALVVQIGLALNGAVDLESIFGVAALPGMVLACRAARHLLKYPRTFF